MAQDIQFLWFNKLMAMNNNHKPWLITSPYNISIANQILISWQFLKEFTVFHGRENFVQREEFKTTLFNAPELEYKNHRGTKRIRTYKPSKKEISNMQTKRWIIAVTTLAMFLCLCACGKNTGLVGRVTDSNGQALAGVKVIAKQVQPVKGYEQFEAVSGADGSFKFAKLFPSSQYVLTTQPENGMTGESVTVNSGPDGQFTSLSAPLVVHSTVSKQGVAAQGTTAQGANAQSATAQSAPADRAEVVAVKEIMKTIKTPREVCEDVQVQEQAPVQDSNRITGTVIGGVAGGVLGHQLGHGRKGKKIATAAGAVGGALVGNQVQKGMQDSDVVTTTKRVCKTVYDESQKVVGYRVTYRLEGKEGVVRTSFRPGATLPVKDGKVDVSAPEAKQ